MDVDAICVQTPVGRVKVVAQAGAIVRVMFLREAPPPRVSMGAEASALEQAQRELEAFFDGNLRVFTVPVRLEGTPFQNRVWAEIGQIPYGQTASYGQIATRLGNPRAGRAVGGAAHRNPVPIFVPCHRVVGGDGALVGFGAGLEIKAALLRLERFGT